ncbi:Rhodanese-related sulfurtransferase [Streptococcus henryi]|uniref:Rhodanese-related sulfurtransferase n=1 Tax=Streptococcus henryi TaxID=439219 RepID=A0A1G6C9X7_9STRE|nr:rhodanese-like domain-containing protein [Streptococcus henryi]SDB29687.1 Rhodanese-related sulfurtransferase [Streptococcus henryi]
MTKNISIADLQGLLDQGGVNLVDVREADEFAAGHVPGAVNLPLSEFAGRYTELAADKPYHIICQMGGRSAQACAFLDAQGYDVTNVDGGTVAWTGNLEK